MKPGRLFTLSILVLPALMSCATVRRSAVRSVADMLSSPDGAGVFTSDDDPRLIAESLPLALKLHEILLADDPGNAGLAAAAGRNFIMYSGAFVHIPADMLDDEEWQEADLERHRAKKLYRRGRDYLLDSLELNHKGFLTGLNSGDYDEAMLELEVQDASSAYWAGLGWLGMAAVDPFDMELAVTLDKAVLLLYRSLELAEANAALHDAMIQVQLAIPPAVIATMRERSPASAAFMDQYYAAAGVGKDPKKRALFHYYRAVSLSEGTDPSPHVTMATAAAIKEQDAEAFREYLGEALAVNPDDNPDARLITMIYQERAEWLLDNIENYFLVDF